MKGYQLIYETFLPLQFEVAAAFGCAQGNSAFVRVMAKGGSVLGGLGSSTWSVMLLAGAFFTVHFNRQPARKECLVTGVVVNTLVVAYTAPNMTATHTVFVDISRYPEAWTVYRIYDYIRLALIGFSAIIILCLYYVMLRTSVPGERKRHPLYHLLRKVVFYPIIMAISWAFFVPHAAFYFAPT
jgi:hypothetical protein